MVQGSSLIKREEIEGGKMMAEGGEGDCTIPSIQNPANDLFVKTNVACIPFNMLNMWFTLIFYNAFYRWDRKASPRRAHRA